MGSKGTKGTKEAGREADKAFEEAQRKLQQVQVPEGGSLAIQKVSLSGPAKRVNECMNREGRDFVRDEYMAILLTLDPSQNVDTIAAMTVDSLRKSIRAAVVNNQTKTTMVGNVKDDRAEDPS